jgi:hypothetical protein
MRRIGNILMVAGIAVGLLAAVVPLLGGTGATTWPWLVRFGLTKLGLLVALASIAAGAVALRVAKRADLRRLLRAHSEEVVITGDRRARDDLRLRR